MRHAREYSGNALYTSYCGKLIVTHPELLNYVISFPLQTLTVTEEEQDPERQKLKLSRLYPQEGIELYRTH